VNIQSSNPSAASAAPPPAPFGARGPLRVGLVQESADADRGVNVERARQRIREAARQGAQLVCLQELFATPYFCQIEDATRFDLSEPLDGPTIRAIADVAQEESVVVVASVFERRAPGLHHNTAVVLGPEGQSLGIYRKMHIPDDPQYHEKFYFAPGDLGFTAIDTPYGPIASLVCWDQWYPEAARIAALRGARVLFYPTAIGWLPEDEEPHGAAQLSAWQTMQRSHAIANGVFVVAVNRVGVERSEAGQIRFWGHSFVADPHGVVLAEAGESEELLVVDCDLQKIDEARRGWPFLRDRRIDAYAGLTSRWLGDGAGGGGSGGGGAGGHG